MIKNHRLSAGEIKLTGRIRRELCADAAYRLLLRQNPRSIYTLAHFDMRKIDPGCGIKLDSISNYERVTGETMQDVKLGTTLISSYGRVILYNTDASGGARRLNWTLAHEVGHALLCHADGSRLCEVEADLFASELLLPEPAVRALDMLFERPLEPELLTAWFNVSLSAAKRRRAELNRAMYVPTPSGEALRAALFPADVFNINYL